MSFVFTQYYLKWIIVPIKSPEKCWARPQSKSSEGSIGTRSLPLLVIKKRSHQQVAPHFYFYFFLNTKHPSWRKKSQRICIPSLDLLLVKHYLVCTTTLWAMWTKKQSWPDWAPSEAWTFTAIASLLQTCLMQRSTTVTREKIKSVSNSCWIKSCLLMCSGNPHRNSL